MAYLVRFLPGGLLQTNIAGCAVFAAISGSSVATAAAIGSVALPQLTERDYDESISVGTIVAGGTLGILIPPSIAMIIYGTFTETSIAKLFMAGLLRSEEHTSELQSLMRNSYAVFCLKKQSRKTIIQTKSNQHD